MLCCAVSCGSVVVVVVVGVGVGHIRSRFRFEAGIAFIVNDHCNLNKRILVNKTRNNNKKEKKETKQKK